jgi:hypothetical protein
MAKSTMHMTVSRLRGALLHVEKANVTLNPSKCEFEKTTVKFLGHIIDELIQRKKRL